VGAAALAVGAAAVAGGCVTAAVECWTVTAVGDSAAAAVGDCSFGNRSARTSIVERGELCPLWSGNCSAAPWDADTEATSAAASGCVVRKSSDCVAGTCPGDMAGS